MSAKELFDGVRVVSEATEKHVAVSLEALLQKLGDRVSSIAHQPFADMVCGMKTLVLDAENEVIGFVLWKVEDKRIVVRAGEGPIPSEWDH